jgi:hypothetical protein
MGLTILSSSGINTFIPLEDKMGLTILSSSGINVLIVLEITFEVRNVI